MVDLHHIYPTQDFTNDVLFQKLCKEIKDIFQDKIFENNLNQRLVDVQLKDVRGKVIFVYREQPGTDTKGSIGSRIKTENLFGHSNRPEVTLVQLRTKRISFIY